MVRRKRCESCDELFDPRPQTPKQSFCSESDCQKERKYQWQRKARSSDPQYRANDEDARKAWVQKNPHYWRNYREEHPEYTAGNREKQAMRNARRGRTSEVEVLEAAPQKVIRLNGHTYVLKEDIGPRKPLGGKHRDSLRVNRVAPTNEDVWIARTVGRHRLNPD